LFIADVHLHSRYSRATSKNLDLENLNYWAQLKGVTVVGTADFTHPEWFAVLEEQLEEAEPGLYKLRDEYSRPLEETLPSTCRGDVRFMLTVEISSIYKKNDKTRKVHNVVFMPSLAAAASFSAELAKIGNIKSDGRPILGLDCRDLLEIVLETHPDAFLVPAHIWTPHFAVLGAASGFETLEECYEELTPHIFAVETGLSSDPPMNWLLSQLDRYTLISNSDAHSPPKLMREANMFETELSYYGIRKAWETGDPDVWKGTIEFFPEEGKYHLDGHRKCEERMTPEETAASDGRCPTCGKKVTVGVFNRVHTLADRPVGSQRENGSPFKHLVPLPEVIGQVFQVGDKSKRVQAEYFRLLHQFGNEFSILTEARLDELAAFSSPLLARGIERIRTGRVDPISGYDGVYGVIKTITEEDREEADRQLALFDVGKEPEKKKPKRKASARPQVKEPAAEDAPSRVQTEPSEHESHPLLTDLNVQQREAVTAESGPSLILAGAGTGKTTTLVRRLAWCVQEQDVNPASILAVTFTQKSAVEIRERADDLLPDTSAASLNISTLHSASARLLRQHGVAVGVAPDFHVADAILQTQIAKEVLATAWNPPDAKPRQLLEFISHVKQQGTSGSPIHEDASHDSPFTIHHSHLLDAFQAALARRNALDFDDLILRSAELLEHDMAGPQIRSGFSLVLVDEAQDLNNAQYEWLHSLTRDQKNLTLIGDPDQSIYSFRGANARIFQLFLSDFPEAATYRLEENYRCPETVLCAAEQLIQNDSSRIAKKLFTLRIDGRPIQLWECGTARIEANRIVEAIEEMVEETSMERRDAKGAEAPLAGIAHGFEEIAILTRTNAQQHVLADALRKAGIPFQAAAAIRKKPSPAVLERFARWRMAANPNDDDALEFLLLEGVKGVGTRTIAVLKAAAVEKGLSLHDILTTELQSRNWKPATRQPVEKLMDTIEATRKQFLRGGITQTVRQSLDESDLLLDGKRDPDALFLHQLAQKFPTCDTDEKSSSLQEFLTEASLRLDSDLLDDKVQSVRLLTIHAAKGLEFPVVFVSGLEEGCLPANAADEDTINEERRLLYVAMTRAKELLILTHSGKRYVHGKEQETAPSRFLRELPCEEFQRQAFSRRLTKKQMQEKDQMRLF